MIYCENSIWVSQNAEFHADFKSLEKVVKKCTLKSYSTKTGCKYATFPLLLMP
jgi:hypothetical protein